MNKKLVVAIATMAIVVVAGVGAWYAYFGYKPQQYVKELVVGLKADPVALEPCMAPTGSETMIVMHMFEGLVKWTEIGKSGPLFEPGLAESWELYNETTWVFHLRKGVKFHCGREMTAYDVKYSRERFDDPSIPAAYRGEQWYGIDRFEVVDNYTILIGGAMLDKPYGPLLHVLSMQWQGVICSEDAKKWGTEFQMHPCGTGPYRFLEKVKGERVVIERNENYWGKKPAIERIIWKPIPDDSARVASLRSGDVDIIAPVPPPEIPSLEANGFRIFSKPGVRSIYLFLNCRPPSPFSDNRVRQAANWAVDLDAIVDKIFGGLAQKMENLLPTDVFGYSSYPIYGYDPNKAKSLLAEAGYEYPNGPKVKFMTSSGRYMMDREMCEAVAGYLEAVGFDVEIIVREWGTHITEHIDAAFACMEDPTYSPPGDISMCGSTCMTMDADEGYSSSFSEGNINYGGYRNPKVDELLSNARYSADPDYRLKCYKEVEMILMEDSPVILTIVPPLILAAKPLGKPGAVWDMTIKPTELYIFDKADMEPKPK